MSDKALTVQTGLDLRSLGEVLASSDFFADTRDATQAIVKVLAGHELGFGPVASMTGIYIVKGKVSLSANLMGAAVKRSGRYNYRVLELTDEAAEIEFYEDGKAIGRSRFTLDDAKKAGLNTSDNWRKYPRNMLFARALSNGVKWYCPDVTGGPAYTPDELGAMVDEDGDVVESEIVERPAAPVYQPKGDQSRRIQTGPVQAPPEPPDAKQQVQQAFTDITWTRNRERVAKMIGAAEQMWAIPRPHAINRVAKALGLDNPQGEYEALFEAIAAYEGSPQDAWKMISAYKSEEETSEDPPLGELCEACGEAPIDPDAPIAGLCTVCANTALDAQADKPARKPARKPAKK